MLCFSPQLQTILEVSTFLYSRKYMFLSSLHGSLHICCASFSVCSDTFNQTVGQSYYGGVETTISPVNVGGCRIACLNNPACVGFDYNKVLQTSPCYLHLEANNLLDFNRKTSPDVDHYRRVFCNGMSTFKQNAKYKIVDLQH